MFCFFNVHINVCRTVRQQNMFQKTPPSEGDHIFYINEVCFTVDLPRFPELKKTVYYQIFVSKKKKKKESDHIVHKNALFFFPKIQTLSY